MREIGRMFTIADPLLKMLVFWLCLVPVSQIQNKAYIQFKSGKD